LKSFKKIGGKQGDVFVKINRGIMSRNQEVKINLKQPFPAKICAPNVKNPMLRQNRTVTGSDVWTIASGFMSSALCMVIVAIPVLSNLFEKTRKISEATHPPTVRYLNTPSGEMAKKSHSEK
jgi:hypothetical protein